MSFNQSVAAVSRKRKCRSVFGAIALCVVSSFPVVSFAQQPNTSSAEDGRAAFTRGREAIDRGDWTTALDAFQISLRAIPSPNTLYYIGRCLRELGRRVEAYDAFVQAAADAGARAQQEQRYTRTAEAAQNDAQALTQQLALVVVASANLPADTSVKINGRNIERSRWDQRIAFEPGPLLIEADANGFTSVRQEGSLVAGTESRIALQMQPAAPQGLPQISITNSSQQEVGNPGSTVGGNSGASIQVQTSNPNGVQPVQPITAVNPLAQSAPSDNPSTPDETPRNAMIAGAVVGGVGVLSVVLGLVAWGSAQSTREYLTTNCGNGPCDPARVPDVAQRVQDGETAVLWANIGIWGGAGVGLAGGLTYIIGQAMASQRSGRQATLPWLSRTTPFVHPGSGSVGLQFSTSF